MNGFLVGRQTLCTNEGEIKGWGWELPLSPTQNLIYIYIYNGFPLCIYFLYIFFFYVITNELYTFHSSNFTKKEKYFLFY